MYSRIIITLLAISFSVQHALAQVLSADNKTFTIDNYKSCQIVEDEEDLSKVYIEISEWENNEFVLQESIELNLGSPNGDLVTFGESIYSKRKFVLINSRYSLFILNLYNDKLIGPLKPQFYGIGEDSQSSMLVNTQIIMDGRFVIGYCVDDGAFLFDLTNLYHPKDVKSASNPFASKNRIFVLQDLEHTDNQFGIFVRIDSWEVDWKTIFTKKKIESPIHPEHKKQYSEIEVEELIMNPRHIDFQFTILKEVVSERDFKYLVFDNQTGKDIVLPKEMENATVEELEKYLSNQ